MDIVEILKWRYATKKFDSTKKLSPAKINVLKEAFNLTATSYGLQPLKLLVIENQEIKDSLVEHSWGQKQVSNASHVLVICIHTSIDASYIKKYYKRVKELRNTPDEILSKFENFLIEDFSKKSDEEVSLWATKQAYIAMGNLLTVCAIEKIDSCPMEGFISDEYDKLLDLAKIGLKSVLVMPVGYRAEDDIFSDMKKVRKQVADSIINY
jgi:nitroreductase